MPSKKILSHRRGGSVVDKRRQRFKRTMWIYAATLITVLTGALFWGVSIYNDDAAVKRGRMRNSPHYVSPDNIGIVGVELSSHHVRQAAAEETKKVEAAADGIRYHLVFSTDCSKYQHWQSYIMFHSALKVGQPGRVTRIASGCNDDEIKQVQMWHDRHISLLSPRFTIHFTPHFSSVKAEDGSDTGKKYDFFNKPFGLKHWMEHGDGIRDGGGTLDEDAVVILIDPDMILLKPITVDFTDERQFIYGPRANSKPTARHVAKGTPFAQEYGFGGQWSTRLDLAKFLPSHSPALKMSTAEAGKMAYGPPYIGYASDMIRIAVKWAEYVPLSHAQYPNLLAEMFAYCVAAADLELEHQIIRSLMVSDSGVAKEGWKFIDGVAGEEVCGMAFRLDTVTSPLPSVLHYCQRYFVGGDWFFGKKRLPKDFFTCESPLLDVPPMDLAVTYDYKIPPPPHPVKNDRKPISKTAAKRDTFALCAMTAALNEAAEVFKKEACVGNANTNLEKTMNLWHLKDKK
eukprot:CAMPEP_0172482230 /NCGR_PEP_ID=MMETSP1066-20121228/8493_1 /TAXON_ID=671091 /ORGANISM="Coscinodiscus wailesii, Strain CCMP2513" /LENGTH=513 /DNA_ID=CAMNT_0013245187 /DNA_START=17 /DNA_END=1558 /DNA_ORIENTATION=+